MNELPLDNYNGDLKIAAFYSFTPIAQEEITLLISELRELAQSEYIRGSVLIASEGINGTICGPKKGINSIHRKLTSLVDQNSLEIKFSVSSKQVFRRFKARKKNEIVTLGVEGIDPRKNVGKYIEPEDWNSFIDDPATLVIDTRNKYEIMLGSFEGSINPHTNTFRDFPEWVEKTLIPLLKENQAERVAMFCTGGIRCEKATSYLISRGISEVHHLHGGILRYLEEVAENESRWKGECFVFDHRVALNHSLLPGTHKLCFACGMPLSPKDREDKNYIYGIQCKYCKDIFDDFDRSRFKERQKHIKELERRLPGNTLWPSA